MEAGRRGTRTPGSIYHMLIPDDNSVHTALTAILECIHLVKSESFVHLFASRQDMFNSVPFAEALIWGHR